MVKTAPDFGKDKIGNILMRLAPPVMAAQLIQALYNIVDSLFVGHDTQAGLTALSIVYPLQLLMIAIAVGTGVGINTVMASKLGVGDKKVSDEYAGVGTPLALILYAPQEYRIGRLMEVYGDSREKTERNLKRSDSARAAYYRTISGNEWGDRAHYDLMVNSSVGVEESADLICSFLRSRIADDSPSVHA